MAAQGWLRPAVPGALWRHLALAAALLGVGGDSRSVLRWKQAPSLQQGTEAVAVGEDFLAPPLTDGAGALFSALEVEVERHSGWPLPEEVSTVTHHKGRGGGYLRDSPLYHQQEEARANGTAVPLKPMEQYDATPCGKTSWERLSALAVLVLWIGGACLFASLLCFAAVAFLRPKPVAARSTAGSPHRKLEDPIREAHPFPPPSTSQMQGPEVVPASAQSLQSSVHSIHTSAPSTQGLLLSPPPGWGPPIASMTAPTASTAVAVAVPQRDSKSSSAQRSPRSPRSPHQTMRPVSAGSGAAFSWPGPSPHQGSGSPHGSASPVGSRRSNSMATLDAAPKVFAAPRSGSFAALPRQASPSQIVVSHGQLRQLSPPPVLDAMQHTFEPRRTSPRTGPTPPLLPLQGLRQPEVQLPPGAWTRS